MSTTIDLAKHAKANIFRRVYIKRRLASTGLFESDWQEITKDVKSFGRVSSRIDDVRPYKFTFGAVKLVVANDSGLYNDNDNENSLWFGYLTQQRTLVRIEAGFIEATRDSTGRYEINEYPIEPLWDEALWDDEEEQSLWDGIPSALFTGVISGDILASDKNEIAFNVKPLTSVFEDYPAKFLTGFTSTGLTASQYVEMLRDHVDANGTYVFRPFFGDTTTYWDISTTSNVYTALNTSTSEEIFDKTSWEIVEKLCEAENFVPYVTGDGTFRFISRDSAFTSSTYQFYGAGQFSPVYGHTIKSVDSIGRKVSKYYSRVRIKYRDEDTTTSYESVESNFLVEPNSTPWVLGDKTLEMENNFFSTSTAVQAAALRIFNEVSSLKREISFRTSFVPGLDIFSIFSIYYDPTNFSVRSLWDQNDWAADDTSTAIDLSWDKASGDTIVLDGDEFKFLSFEIDLDNMENIFLAREQ